MENIANKISIGKKLISLAEWIVSGIGLCIITYVTFLVFRYSFNTADSIPKSVNLLVQAVGVILFGILLFGLGYIIRKYTRLSAVISVAAYILTIIILGIVSWSFVSQTLLLPVSDAKSCYDIALRFLKSDFGAVVPQDSYLSLWPFQTGYIFILEKSMRIFNVDSPLFFQRVNCGYLLIMVTAGYVIVRIMTKRIEVHLAYLVLMLTYRPIFFKTSEVYGDFPALALMMLSVMFFVLYNRTEVRWHRYVWVTGFVCSTIGAVAYKKNCLIYIVALLLVTIIRQIKRRDYLWLVVVIVVAVIGVGYNSMTQKYYEHYAQNNCGEGVPAVAYLAMGLQYNGPEAIPGGWNGFHSNTYINTGYDYEETVRISKDAIRDSLQHFSDDPKFMFSLYYNKVLKQWANHTHGVYWGIQGLFDTSRDADAYWVNYLNNQDYNKHTGMEDLHESIIYAVLFMSILYLFVRKCKRNPVDFAYTLPYVTFIGGFLFSLLWEGQTDGVLYYPVLLLPIALGVLCYALDGKNIDIHYKEAETCGM